jgi:hypothetical protein
MQGQCAAGSCYSLQPARLMLFMQGAGQAVEGALAWISWRRSVAPASLQMCVKLVVLVIAFLLLAPKYTVDWVQRYKVCTARQYRTEGWESLTGHVPYLRAARMPPLVPGHPWIAMHQAVLTCTPHMCVTKPVAIAKAR